MVINIMEEVIAFLPPELFLLWFLQIFYIVGSLQIYEWARKVVKEGHTVSRTRKFVVVFTLCIISAFYIAYYAYYSSLLLSIYGLILLSILDFFPIYTLFRRKLIRNRWVYLTALFFLLCLVLIWFLFR